MRFHLHSILLFVALTASSSFLAPAIQGQGAGEASIMITLVPPPGAGPDRMESIAGRVDSVDPSRYKVSIFSFTDMWYVQPFVAAPLTSINADGTWSSTIHLGNEYAALLVEPSYRPPSTTFALPEVGAGVVAAVRVPAKK